MRTKFSGILTLFLALIVQITFAQEKTISGTVTDDKGLPLPGVNVIVKNTSNGTQTDFDGNYTIKANRGAVLSFSYVGFTTKENVVGDSSTVNVQLAPSASELEEVVVVAYGVERRSSVTSAIATVKAEDLEQVPLATFDQILQGKVPGLEVSSGSGQPGSPPRVRIRGTSSILGNSNPLYIVDGIQIDPTSFASLNANDFESVSVLKDAEATSLYGARGAAGVIVIRTKAGKFGQKTKFTYRTLTGISEAPELQVDVLNARQFLELSRELGFNGAGGLTDAQITEQVEALGDFTPQDALVRTGRTFSHELSVEGGSENTRFFSSISYFEQEGTVNKSKLERVTSRLNLNHRANEKLEFSLGTTLGFSRSDNPPSNGGVNLANPFLAPFIGNPTVPVFNEDGSFNSGNPTLSRLLPNILEDIETGLRENEEFKLITTLQANYKFTDYLSVNYNIGIDFEDDFTINAFSPNSFRGQTVPAITDENQEFFGSQNEASIRDLNLTSTLQLRYEDVFSDKHAVNASLFWEVVNRDFRSSTFTGYGIEPALFGFANSITAGTTDNGLIPTVGGVRVRNSIVSYFGRAGYSYDDRYGFNFSLRSDKSSRVATENSDILFYSVGARWSIDNEAFMADADWVDQLKVRASYGTTGNDNSAGANDFIQTLGTTLYQGGRQLIAGGIANVGAKWEFTEQLNLGLDFGFFQNRISGTFDYYKAETKDLFVNINLPGIYGDTGLNGNAGVLENEGFEVALNLDLIRTDELLVSLSGNVGYNFGRITDLGSQVDQFVNGTSIVRVGEQLGSHFVVEYAGVNPANGEPLYRDLDGNVTNQFSQDFAKTGFGSSEPLYTGGFGLSASYKGFSFSSLFAFQAEVARFNNTTFFMENGNFFGSGLNQSVVVLDRWQQPGDITDIPAYFVDGVAVQRQFASNDIEDASFVRLRDLTIAYNLPSQFLNEKFVKSVRVYARGINLVTWTNFTGLDPEDSNNITSFEYPNARQYTFGIDVSF